MYNRVHRLDNDDLFLASSQYIYSGNPTTATLTYPTSFRYPSHPPSPQFSLRHENSSPRYRHNIIIGFLIGSIIILATAFCILLLHPLFQYIKRKSLRSQKRIDLRYETIERWLISKRVQAHCMCPKTIFLSTLPMELSQEEAPLEKRVMDPLILSHSDNCSSVHNTEFLGTKDRRHPPTAVFKSHSSITNPTIETEATEPSSDADAVIEDEDTVTDLEKDSFVSSSLFECSICLEPFLVNEVVSWSTNVSCGHVFHHQCIKEWLLRRIDCPCCRETVLSFDSKSPGKLSKEEFNNMVDHWHSRMLSTYYCVEEGLVQLDQSVDLKCDLTEDGIAFISSHVKRDELITIRGNRALNGENHSCNS